MDTVGSERAALYGCGMTGQVALLFAALHPDRVTALILHSTVARHFAAVDYPRGGAGRIPRGISRAGALTLGRP